ncbi:ExbD/TolR family protein [Sediminispirochaeta smaragdinae]|jgi:biopolymer transport protein ExbD|uniref:Biopolymer transport protein ExbD/TolR n=1 Tax=Sediminispirochaeta smaragdinae (strain DSM 11293 / JCM 15392 / SEBR 4228) TaxID=573413 RepID=E1R5H3_SEDSS|nr:biopolymer transporter ExbD [Sediminispirochaeta smaragdinae]ADK82301.1 Biopolymer transport protein ExbD/TolR [Sediminispirochaeta smaragdinae DSM 11293]
MTFRRRLKPTATVDLVPMIDVVFQLVIFFMVSSTFLLTPGISIELPSSSTAEPAVMTRLVVTVVSEDEIYLNRDRYALADLKEGLASLRSQDDIKAVIIEGDSGVSYSLMVRLLDVLRTEGFTGITLRTKDDAP